MQKPITPDVVVAYAHCPRKAFLLLRTDEPGAPHAYPGILAQQQRANRAAYLDGFRRRRPEARAYAGTLPHGGGHPLLAATLRVQDVEAYCDILTPATRETAERGRRYEPTLVVGTHTIAQEQRLALALIGYVLGQLQRARPPIGVIVGLDGRTHSVQLRGLYAALDPILATLRGWTAAPASDPPPAVLNAHCPQCPFQAECAARAERDDDLSLLDRMTARARQRYHDRGIFTVRQLSYLFRPRRRKPSARTAIRHQPELQALALRTGTTYLHELPALDRGRVEFFLDIEGVPDRQAYYLVGLLLCRDGVATYRAFWADAAEDEAQVWRHLLAALKEHPDAPIYHYGAYEPRALVVLARRHRVECEGLARRLVNLNACVYGKVYFPLRSNRLKEIGRWLGVAWPTPDSSGLQSLVWRRRWEESRDEAHQHLLLAYNEADCRALLALADELTRLRDTAAVQPKVDFAARPKRHATDMGEQIHQVFEAILRSAHARYEETKISLRQPRGRAPDAPSQPGGQPGHEGHGRVAPRARTVVRVAPRRECPRCGDGPLRASSKLAEKTIIDLVFTPNGCRKTVTKYVGAHGYCRRCDQYYRPPEIAAFGHHVYGHGFQAWVIYQRLALRLPYRAIVQALEEQFGERISEGSIVNFLKDFAGSYAQAEDRLRRQLLASPFIHVDETKVNIQGVYHYAWVFTDGRHVLFRLTPTRESTVAQEILAGYEGVLITDFYAGYDAVPCRQQRCLVHLIRDLNEDLWKAPFDREFEAFVLEVRDLLTPILEAVGRYGLRKRHLGKFVRRVEHFYKTVIADRTYRSELAQTYQKRFRRYRQSLFTFLEHDGIPWNNNMAERAIRHLAVQRKISGFFFEAVASQYLLLLGLAQTCRFQGKSLLKFLLSGEQDIDAFKATKRARSRASGAASMRRGPAEAVRGADPVASPIRVASLAEAHNRS